MDCAGARLHVHARSSATVLSVDGEVDASNAHLLEQAIRRYARLNAPLILDLTEVDFLGMAGFRALLVLNCEHQRAGLHWSVIGGARLRRLTRIVTNHGLPLVDSVSEALQIIDDGIRLRRQCLPNPARQHEPQRMSAAMRLVARRATA
ncbi:sulfate transporter [Mycobacterium sp. 1100029.7]|nr:sulfate transporter [Mycobacterium sp. 1100029.7]